MMALATYAKPSFTDCDPVKDKEQGEFTPVNMFNTTWNDTIFYGYAPTTAG
jgi:hypothetical protein